MQESAWLHSYANTVTRLIEALGIFVIVLGAVVSTVFFLREAYRGMQRDRDAQGAYKRFRRRLGRAILLGLEFLVAADIIRTVAVEPSFNSLGILAIIVLIRTFLSFALEVEISGRWPWQEEPESEDSSHAAAKDGQ